MEKVLGRNWLGRRRHPDLGGRVRLALAASPTSGKKKDRSGKVRQPRSQAGELTHFVNGLKAGWVFPRVRALETSP
jgi:hypothetical protein